MASIAAQPADNTPYAFVSYASADRERVLPVVAALERAGILVWIDREGIHGGENYAAEINDAIQHAAAFVLMCSATSLASRNVRQEIALAWEYERPYIPLLLEEVAIPGDVKYWLTAAQWIEVLPKQHSEWLPHVLTALAPLGIAPKVAERERVRLAGREKELDLLREKLTSAKEGKGGLVLIGGEAGIGKTTLADILLHEAAGQGCIVLEGHCFDLAETPPYGPFIDLFLHLPTLPALPPLPEAFAVPGTVGTVPSQMALFAQVEGFLKALSSHKPVAILLDDMHWSDPASLDLLRFLARSVASLPLLLLATYRSDEITRKHPLYPLLAILAREAGGERIDLARLDDAAVRSLVGNRYSLPDAEIDRLVSYLRSRAEGNALFVGELLRSLEESGALERDGEGWRLGDLAQGSVPILLRQVIDARVARLGEEGQRLLAIAAVIGHEVPLDLWTTVAETDEDAALAVVERALDARLLVEVGQGIRFAHALIREALYEGMAGIRRRRIHQRVGEALADARNPDPDAVAYHFHTASDARALEWLIRAGERARRANADHIAIDRFEAALALMDLTHPGDSDERAWLLVRLALAYRLAQPEQSEAHLREAVLVAAQGDDHALAAAARYHLGLTHCFTGDLARGVAEMEAGLAALEALATSEQRRVADLLATSVHHWRGTLILYLAASGNARRAVMLGGRDVPETLANGSWFLGLLMAQALLGIPAAAAEPFRRAGALERAGHNDRQLGFNYLLHLELVALTYHPDDLDARRRLAEEGEGAWQRARIGYPDSQPPRIAWLPLLLVAGGWEELARLIPTLGIPNASYAAVVLSVVGPFARLRGDAAGAWGHVRAVLPDGPATKPGGSIFFVGQQMQRVAAALALDEGDLSSAREWLDMHDRWLEWSGAALGQSEGQALWAQFPRQAGDIEKAREHAERALAHADEPRQPLALLAAHRLLGELDTEAGRYDDAARHLDASLALADACAAPYERALTLLAMAELHAASGRNDKATPLIDEVKAICEPLGAKPALARADALTARLTIG